MKINVTFKCPDAVSEAVNRHIESLEERPDDMEILNISDEIHDKLAKWVTYGEYVTVEFDTDAGTALVTQRRK